MGLWVLRYLNEGAVLAGFPKSKIKSYRYAEGERLAKEFPKRATVQFADKFKDRRKLNDFVFNIQEALFVSSKVKGILDQLEVPDLEFLSVTIKDHKGAIAADDYFILNPIGQQDVIDLKKSKVLMDKLMEDEIFRIKKLALQPKAVPKGPCLFRAARMPRLILIDDTVRDAFEEQGVTGYQVFKAENWDGRDAGEAVDADEA